MTSAVLNNLDFNTADFSNKEKCQEDMSSNRFSKILESKTTQKEQSNITDNNTVSQTTVADTERENSATRLPKDKTEQNTSILVSKDSTVINDVLEEVTSEIPLDITIIQENSLIKDTLNNISKNESIITENSTTTSTTTEENTNSQDTITNEDPTMNKEQITTNAPENLLTLSLMQTTTQTLKVTDSGNDENIIQLSASDKNTDFKNDNSSSVKEFRLPENSKDMLVMENTLEDDEVVTKAEGSKLRNIIDESVVEELNIESVDTDGNPSQQNSSDLMKNQTPQEQGIKAVLQGNVKFDDNSLNVSTQIKNSSTELSAGKILEQISKQMENMHNGSKVNIVLNPEALGRVSLQIVNGKEGLIAQFSVTSQDVKDILMKGLAGLKESLLAQGVSVDNVTVKLADTGDSEYQGDWTEREGSQGGFKGQGNKHQKEDEKQFEKMMFEIENNGNV